MGTMTKKDFIAIAKAIKDAREEYERDDTANVQLILDNLSRSLADVCASTNSLFVYSRFLAACGVRQ